MVRHEEPAAGEPERVRLQKPDEVAALCKALVPVERLRGPGDAIQRGEAEARHDAERDAALERRYEVVIPGSNLTFSPYDPKERRLALSYRVELWGAGGAARVWAAEDRGLPVEVDPAIARRVLAARKAGTLALAIAFDLPDDAACGGGTSRPRRFVITMEPVGWTYLDGETVLARGGAGSDRPLVTAAQGAKPQVVVGDPISGPVDAKGRVAARAADLQACYADALRRNPATDGVLVAELGAAGASLAADSVGDPALAACVKKALERLGGGGKAAVPIRFVLEEPTAPPSAHSPSQGPPLPPTATPPER